MEDAIIGEDDSVSPPRTLTMGLIHTEVYFHLQVITVMLASQTSC